MSGITTSPPERTSVLGRTRVSSDVEGGPTLWFEIPEEHAHLLSDRADFVAIGLLLPAMPYRRDLHVGGSVTDTLLQRLNGDVQDLMHAAARDFHRVRVTADASIPASSTAEGVGTGFSGGIDSLTVLLTYALSDDVPPALHLTHLLYNNVGSHAEGGRELWRRRYTRLAEAAAEIGLPFVPVDSNIEEHFPRMGFLETVSFRNCAVAHLLGGGIGRLVYASGFTYADVRMPDHGEISRIDTVLLPLLSTGSVTLEPANAGLTRVQKTLAIADRPERRWLDVCVAPDEDVTNCSRCWKCMRTMLTLDIAGRLDEFCPTPFRREPYSARLPSYRAEVLASTDPQCREIVRLAADRGWRWGTAAHLRAIVLRLRARIHAAARKLVRKVRRRLPRLGRAPRPTAPR